MSSSRFPAFGLAALVGLLAVASTVTGCEDDTTNSGPIGGFDGGSFDGGGTGALDGAPSPGQDDAGGGDDAGSFPIEPGISLANLWGAPLDFCFRPPKEVDFQGPVFAAQGGVPDRAVSVRHPVPPGSFVVLVNAGQGCESQPIFTGGTVTTDQTPALTYVVRGGTIKDARKVFFRPQQHVAGKENVYYGRQGRDAFFASSGGGAAIPLNNTEPTALDPGLTGQLELRTPSDEIATRPMKTAAGVVLLLDAPLPESTPLLCDLLAPPTGHLHVCDETVRAP